MLNNKQLTHKEKVSMIFSTARIYALISIVCAHIYFADGVVSSVFSRVGSIGVIVFLIISGYFYRTNRFGSFFNMIKKKIISIIIPWLVLGTLTWLYNFILTVDKSRFLISYINWIVGNGSYLYYLNVLFICFLIFYKNNKYILVFAVIFNIISIVCTAFGLLSNILNLLRINNYLNIFNWIGFFALGIMLQSVKDENIVRFILKSRFIFLALFNVALIVLIIFSTVEAHYFSLLAIPFELLGTLAIMGISTYDLTKIKVFKGVSNYSFTIYLVHVVFIGLLDVVFMKNIILIILCPALIICVCYILLWFVLFLAKKIKLKNFACLILGIRDR